MTVLYQQMQELIFPVISISTICFLLFSNKKNEDECPQVHRLYTGRLATNNTQRKYQKKEGRLFCYKQEQVIPPNKSSLSLKDGRLPKSSCLKSNDFSEFAESFCPLKVQLIINAK
jgi:hypothetical protein